MSDTESSDLEDSEMELDEVEDENLLSSDSNDDKHEEGDNNEKEEEEEEEEEEMTEEEPQSAEEIFMEDEDEDDDMDGEELDDTSDDSDSAKKLTEDELRRINMDDFSSDDEEAGNTVGNIPMKWYDKYDHIGYDLNGEKIMRPKNMDSIDKFIHSHDQNERWTIYDEKNGEVIKLTPRQIAIVQNIQNHRFGLPGYNDEAEYVPYFSGEVSVMPWRDPPPSKSSFIPSRWERRRVDQIVKGIREGRYKPREKTDEKPMYEMWADENTEEKKSAPPNLMAPKLPLPDHSESYNPPAEYLLSESEKKKWDETDPEDRYFIWYHITHSDKNYVPQKFNCLRRVPLYFVKERYDRCLDLYLCPRTLKRKMNIDRNILLPQLPNIAELRPFPTTQCMEYAVHTGRVRSVQVDSTGYYLASGGDDKEVVITELITGRVMKRYMFPDTVQELRWNPNKILCDVLAVSCDSRVFFLDTELSGLEEVHQHCQELLRSSRMEGAREETRGVKWFVNGTDDTSFVCDENVLLLKHINPVHDMAWHYKGDYFCVNASDASSSLVYIHQLSRGHSQLPLPKIKGVVQRVMFNTNSKPYLFVATQTEVKIYNLVKQTLVSKLKTGVKWVSSIDVHPGGDNLVVGSYDSRLSWFDLDLASTPYKTLRYHKKAVRRVQFHHTYPLMSTCSDDGTIHIFHTTVYNDFVHNALIVPLKVLRGHTVSGDLGVLDTEFHPTQPWIITAGADHTIRMYINIP